ncbi:hypothetical protein COCHEDRAFT_1227513 [Bipolaris maydis C5]|uniref:Cyanovirin-N domain-containing protein n=2 Tax=Cochliobolus heterostrophus TaxID=5016 RepID=M2UGS5_COCH5|nr:hypothetical protein COCHEDRAFT_1227513 [Bipolaris maydis C5]KAJ6211821.1 hypothetical protein PSV09DRAFT_1227513 [Bipolaris maydis]
MNIFLCHLKVTIHIFTHDYRDPDAMFKIFLLAALGRAVLAVPAEAIQGTALDRRANTWEAHAKYYGLGGSVGNEIYISGTWEPATSKPIGSDTGPCTASIGGISTGTPFNVNCACQITSNNPFGITSECILDFSEEDSGGNWAAAFSVAFVCNAFSSCTGTNAYAVSSPKSRCTNQAGNPCGGFRVTP